MKLLKLVCVAGEKMDWTSMVEVIEGCFVKMQMPSFRPDLYEGSDSQRLFCRNVVTR